MKEIKKYKYGILFTVLVIVVALELLQLKQLSESAVSENIDVDEFFYYMDLVDQIFAELHCFPVIKEDRLFHLPLHSPTNSSHRNRCLFPACCQAKSHVRSFVSCLPAEVP